MQTVPQPPQLALSLRKSTHPLGHASSPSLHSETHCPPKHAAEASHTTPGLPPLSPHPAVAPQWERSAFGSTHFPLQITAPAGQLTEQVPLMQRSAPWQACPQLPQLARSVAKSMHSLLHGFVPALHARATHAESSQRSEAAQALSH